MSLRFVVVAFVSLSSLFVAFADGQRALAGGLLGVTDDASSGAHPPPSRGEESSQHPLGRGVQGPM